MTERDRWYIAFIAALASCVVIVSLLVIGNSQANQYREVVDRIDANSKAVVCILRVLPSERNADTLAPCLEDVR